MAVPGVHSSEATAGFDAGLARSVVQASADAIVGLTREGVIEAWSDGAERLYGYAAEEARGRSIGIVDPEGAGGEVALCDAAVAGRRVEVERRHVRRDGRHVDVAVTVFPVGDPGSIIAVGYVARDVSVRERGEDEGRLRQAAERGTDAVISIDLEGRIRHWHRGARRLFGLSVEEAIGRRISELAGFGEGVSEAVARCVAGDVASRCRVWARRGDGGGVELLLTFSRWHVAGRVVGVTCLATQLGGGAEPSDGERADRGRERAAADLERVQRLARLGLWDWNPGSGEGGWSAVMYEIFGRDRSLGAAVGEELLGYVCGEDRDRVAGSWAQTAGGGAGCELDCSILAGDGVVRVVHARLDRDPGRPGWCVGSVQDISEQRRAYRELVEASARAEVANRAKSEVLARISHALRTPLNTIIGFGQLLELEQLGPRERGHVSFVLKAARQLLDTVDSVVELAAIQSGEITISSEPVAIVDAVRYAIALVAPLARQRDVRVALGTDLLTLEGRVQADPDRLHRVLLGVLSNAIQYNRPGGRVDVSFALTERGRLRTAISDSGIGIAPDRLGDVFEPFARLGAEDSEIEGAGLGLALAKGLIEAMGGTIEVRSEPALGTTVVFELAAVEPSETAQGALELPEVGGMDDERRRIIYIEDNLANLTLVTRILEEHAGVELVPAMQAAIGLELAREHHPDLIVLDLHLPDMPGADALTRLKAEHPEIPVVVLTADARPGQEELVRELGAADYMTKPLDVQRFLTIIATHLRARPSDRP